MPKCGTCNEFKLIPDTDINDEIFFYSVCDTTNNLINSVYNETIESPAWCPKKN